MDNHGNGNLEAGISADKKAWGTPRMEKLDVSVHTQNALIGLIDDGLLGATTS